MVQKKTVNRREFINRSAGAIAALSLAPLAKTSAFSLQATPGHTKLEQIELEPLPYAFDALEPHIDARTMEIHHDKHHAGYIRKLKASLDGWAGTSKVNSLESIFAKINEVPAQVFTSIRNNGGGAWNHSLFWKSMTPASTKPSDTLASKIDRDFGGMESMKAEFSTAAATRFGSGWAWLNMGEDGRLFISSTPNQDNPLMESLVEKPGIPLLGLDVWEHAYYLHYQNRRTDYISAFWEIVNWETVSNRFEQAKS